MQAAVPVIFLGLGGLLFGSLGWIYLWEGIEDLQGDEFEFAVSSSWRHWHHTYSVHDHPLLFAVKVLMDVTGAVGGLGIGLCAFGFLISIGLKNDGPVVKKMEAMGKPLFTTAFIAFGAHFVLVLVPYLLEVLDTF